MKKLVIAFILGIALSGNAQDFNRWQVGYNLNPFIFSRLSGNPNPEKDKQDLPNGLGFGLTIEKKWNDHWGFKTGFESCKQSQKYDFSYGFGADNTYTNLHTNKINSEYTYYKLPISIQFFFPLNDKLYLVLNQGFQYSLLKNYKVEETYKNSNFRIIENGFQIINENNKFPYELFKKNLFGIIGSIGLKGFLTERFTYSTNLRYEYDLTTSDINPITVFGWGDLENNIQSKNFRFGLELGIQYNFSIYTRFDSRPR